MTYGIIITKSDEIYFSHLFFDKITYDFMQEHFLNSNSFIAGKKEINDDRIEIFRKQVNDLVSRLNQGEDLNIEKELIMLSTN